MAAAAIFQLMVVPGTRPSLYFYNGRMQSGAIGGSTAVRAGKQYSWLDSNSPTGLVSIESWGIIYGKRRRRIKLAVSADEESRISSSSSVAVDDTETEQPSPVEKSFSGTGGVTVKDVEAEQLSPDKNSIGSGGDVTVEDVDAELLSPDENSISGSGDVTVEDIESAQLPPNDNSISGRGEVKVEDVEGRLLSPDENTISGSDDVTAEEVEAKPLSLDERSISDKGDVTVEDVEAEQLSPEEEDDRENIREILRVLELLRTKRDMTFNEVKLTITIEDPRDVERRTLLNLEDDRGCSREELGLALAEVYEGRIPTDRTILQELTKEMVNWPNLEDEIYPATQSPLASPYAKVTDTGVDPKVAAERARVEWDSAADIQPGNEQKDMSESLPPAVGFSFLYLLSSLPIFIGIAVVAILFFNSLQ